MADQGDTGEVKNFGQHVEQLNITNETVWKLISTFQPTPYTDQEKKRVLGPKSTKPLVDRSAFANLTEEQGIDKAAIIKAIEFSTLQAPQFKKPDTQEAYVKNEISELDQMIEDDLVVIEGDILKRKELEELSRQASAEKRLKQHTFLYNNFRDVWDKLHSGVDTTPEESLAQEKSDHPFPSQRPSTNDTQI